MRVSPANWRSKNQLVKQLGLLNCDQLPSYAQLISSWVNNLAQTGDALSCKFRSCQKSRHTYCPAAADAGVSTSGKSCDAFRQLVYKLCARVVRQVANAGNDIRITRISSIDKLFKTLTCNIAILVYKYVLNAGQQFAANCRPSMQFSCTDFHALHMNNYYMATLVRPWSNWADTSCRIAHRTC